VANIRSDCLRRRRPVEERTESLSVVDMSSKFDPRDSHSRILKHDILFLILVHLMSFAASTGSKISD
jgi:hypothetical protein